VYGGDCPTVTLGDMQDDSKSHTLRPGDIAISSPYTMAIVLDSAEPGSGPSMVVSQLILTFYNPINGDVIYTTDLNTPTVINDATPGSGVSGHVFGLDWDQAVLAQGFISASGVAFNDVRVGLGAEFQQFDGHAYFWIGNIPGLVPPPIPPEAIPEPATFVLFGGGLLALGLAGRRFRRN